MGDRKAHHQVTQIAFFSFVIVTRVSKASPSRTSSYQTCICYWTRFSSCAWHAIDPVLVFWPCSCLCSQGTSPVTATTPLLAWLGPAPGGPSLASSLGLLTSSQDMGGGEAVENMDSEDKHNSWALFCFYSCKFQLYAIKYYHIQPNSPQLLLCLFPITSHFHL